MWWVMSQLKVKVCMAEIWVCHRQGEGAESIQVKVNGQGVGLQVEVVGEDVHSAKVE